jgi:outer membrane protein assembly factor BamB
VTSRGEINAYDYQTGKPLWVNKDLTWRTPSAPVVMDRDVIALGDFDGEIHLMDSRTGEIIGRTDVDGAVRVQPVPMGEGALIQTVEGELTYLRIEKKE